MAEYYRRDHHRQRGGGRHAGGRAGPVRQEHPPARARRLSAAREAELELQGRVRRQPLRLEGDLDRQEGQAVPARHSLLRRRRDQDVRRRALPSARARLRRAPAPGRPVAGLADLLRRHGALLHAGREPLSGSRRARRGPHRSAGQRSLSAPGRLARAAHPAASRRSGARRLQAVSLPLRHPARRSASRPFPPAFAASTATGFPVSSTPSPTPRRSRSARRSNFPTSR